MRYKQWQLRQIAKPARENDVDVVLTSYTIKLDRIKYMVNDIANIPTHYLVSKKERWESPTQSASEANLAEKACSETDSYSDTTKMPCKQIYQSLPLKQLKVYRILRWSKNRMTKKKKKWENRLTHKIQRTILSHRRLLKLIKSKKKEERHS